MEASASRRAFLSGRIIRDNPEVMRPPGAVYGTFSQLCTQCGDCVSACPENILVLDGDRRPIVRFETGACTFCGDCAEACESGALDVAQVSAWPWRAQIKTSCLSLNGVSCRACQDACEASAIRFQLQLGGRAQPILNTQICTGCGACASACPTDAVAFTRQTPHQLEAVE